MAHPLAALPQVAYETKTRQLDGEMNQLRAYGKERQNQVQLLERRVAELEQTVRESEERARQLSNEKGQLAHELKAAQRELSKLDSFKRSILQSIKDEELSVGAASGVGYTSVAAADFASRDTALATMPTPAKYSPLRGANPPPTASSPPGVPSSAGGPDGGSSAHLDGKDFFRQARLRLTYDQFNQFLSNIKRLNDHAQSRDETLTRAQEIFGAENDDLFTAFKQLLSKHGLAG